MLFTQIYHSYIHTLHIVQLEQSSNFMIPYNLSDATNRLRKSFVPNYKNLDPAVQSQINSILLSISKQSNKNQYQKMSQLGLLEEAPLLRSQIWKVLLDVMNVDPQTWENTRKKNSELYQTLIQKFFPSYIDDEDLLDICQNSIDRQLWEEISLDTKRTHSGLNFFQIQITQPKIYITKPTKHCDVLTKILYIWAKIHPAVRYVQGMNQILAPLYYLEFQSLDSRDVCWDRESEIFFMFSAIMSFVIDMHIKEMDDCDHGIMGRMITLNKLLKIADYQLWKKMHEQNIQPEYYSFRWLALLLAQQFGLYDTIKLWDFLLSYEGDERFFFLNCLCVAILKIRKNTIMESDFISALPIIQKLRDMDVEQVIKLGTKLYKKFRKVNIEKLFVRILQEQQKMKSIKEKNQMEKERKWTYNDLLKSTGNYLSKFAYWKKKQ